MKHYVSRMNLISIVVLSNFKKTIKVIFHTFFTDTTCPYKCNIWIKNLHSYGNTLQEVDLTIGNEKKIFNPCSRSNHRYNVNLSINCSSWIASK